MASQWLSSILLQPSPRAPMWSRGKRLFLLATKPYWLFFWVLHTIFWFIFIRSFDVPTIQNKITSLFFSYIFFLMSTYTRFGIRLLLDGYHTFVGLYLYRYFRMFLKRKWWFYFVEVQLHRHSLLFWIVIWFEWNVLANFLPWVLDG